MNIENPKSVDPFADESDPPAKTADGAPASGSKTPLAKKHVKTADDDSDSDHEPAPAKKLGKKPAKTVEDASGSKTPLAKKHTKTADDDSDSDHEPPLAKELGKKPAKTVEDDSISDHEAPLRKKRTKPADDDSASDLDTSLADDIGSLDPFQYDENPLEGADDVGSNINQLHVRIQQRNGRKTWTMLQGIPPTVSTKKLLKAFKKEFACNGTVIHDKVRGGKVIQLQGDHRAELLKFLVLHDVPKPSVKLHGF